MTAVLRKRSSVHLRVTEEDKALFRRAAGADGRSISDWLRRVGVLVASGRALLAEAPDYDLEQRGSRLIDRERFCGTDVGDGTASVEEL